MKLKSIITAACMAIGTATAGFATPVPVNFSFSFTGTSSLGGTETVTGLIEGLLSDGAGQQATKVTVTGLGETNVFTTFQYNHFDVSASVIDLASLDLLSPGISPDVNFCGTRLVPICSAAYYRNSSSAEVTSATTQATFTATAVSTVPVPAAGVLLLTGLAGVAGLKYMKKRAA